MKQTYIDNLNTDNRKAVMRLYGTIGVEVNGHWFAQELAALDRENHDVVEIHGNTPGGDVIQGMSIVSAIMSMNTPVHFHVEGVAASMGAVIAVSADRLVMMDFAKMMIHDPAFSGRVVLSPKEQKTLGRIKDMLQKVLSRRGKDETEVSNLMTAETWFSADEAKEHGLCDEILPSAKNELFNLSPTEIIAKINAEYQPKTDSDMIKLTNEARTALGIADSATETDISAAVIAMQNALNTATAATTAAEQRATAAENKLAEIENAKTEAQKAEATNLIAAAKKDGRINAADTAAVKAWEDAFAANHENAKTILNGLPKHTPVAPTLGGTAGSADNSLVNQSWDELDKSGKLADLKSQFPDEYAAKFEQKFGKKPNV